MEWSLTRVTPPADLPLTLGEAKAQLRIDDDITDDDAEIMAWVRAATEELEDPAGGWLGRALVTQTLRLALDGFPDDAWRVPAGRINLPHPPLQSVTSITYVDTDGDTQTLAADRYLVVVPGKEAGYVVPEWGTCWPATRGVPEAVKITYVAGFGGRSDVPELICSWLKLRLADFYKHRETLVTGTIVSPVEFAQHLLASVRRSVTP